MLTTLFAVFWFAMALVTLYEVVHWVGMRVWDIAALGLLMALLFFAVAALVAHYGPILLK